MVARQEDDTNDIACQGGPKGSRGTPQPWGHGRGTSFKVDTYSDLLFRLIVVAIGIGMGIVNFFMATWKRREEKKNFQTTWKKHEIEQGY
jgi:hypothetical protein